MKKILVLPVKNEDWILENSLACASLWADHIVVADQNSTDRSREIYKQFPKVLMIENSATFHSSNVRKLLLNAVREFGLDNAIFSFDADEIPTAEILNPAFWEKIASLPRGSALEMQWIQLWRSPLKFRDDKSMWSNSWKVFGFIDDGQMQYDNLNVVNDHTSRVPTAALKNIFCFQQPKVLHYQFANWSRMLSKQCYYRIMEFLKSKKSFFQTMRINLKYLPTRDESGMALRDLPESWIKLYLDLGINLKTMQQEDLSWYDREVLGLIAQNGVSSFKWLDIWNVDWAQKSVALKSAMPPDLAKAKSYGRFGNLLQTLLYQNSIAYKSLKKIKTYVKTNP